jgi:DNA-binding transcriptional MerR regulator
MQTLLAPRDAGKLLGLSSVRVQQLDREGRLVALRDSAGRRLFRKADVLKFRQARERLAIERQRAAGISRQIGQRKATAPVTP